MNAPETQLRVIQGEPDRATYMGSSDCADVPGYEGLYAVTRNGRVWSYPKMRGPIQHAGRWLTFDRSSPYARVTLQKDCIKCRWLVHRLIGSVFIPNPLALPEINHKDGVKSNLHVDNLEWCTTEYNQQHAFRIGLKPVTDRQREARRANARKNLTQRKFDADQVAEIRRLHSAGHSASSIGRRMGATHRTILNYLGRS